MRETVQQLARRFASDMDGLEAHLRERIAVLFSDARPVGKALGDAEVWLREFSKSEDAWIVVLRILERPDASAIEALFCARLLHDLLRRCVSKTEKTQASHAAFTEHEWSKLRERLFALTKRYAAASGDSLDARGTVTQLVLCVAALSCKMPSWNAESVVQDVIEAFASDASVSNEAKVLCLCSFLAVIPQEAQSRELSIHPMRREQVIDGMKNTASAVMDLLQQLVTAAGSDSMIQKHVLDALEAWADLADVTRAFPRLVVEGALHIVAAEVYPSSMKQSAAGAARASLEQCVWTKDQGLRDLLAAGLMRLREEVVLTTKSQETRVLICDILSAVAMRALRDQKDATKNPFATGPDAAGDRSYIKYAEFKRLQREQKKNAQQQTGKEKTGFAVDIDVDVLLFALDGLSDALSMGVSVSSALEPWSKLAKSFMADSVVASLRPVAARALHASVAYVRSVPRHELDDDQKKEEISDCLRDVVSVVPIAEILDDFNARFSAELHAGDWKMINARLYVLLALVKSFHSCAKSSFECLIEHLRVLLTHEDHVSKSSQASACWVLAGLSGYMCSILAHANLLCVAHTLILRMRHREHTIARGASVAMMRLSEQSAAVAAFGCTDVPSLLAEIHATGGPTPTPTLELGQERESTILLRCLTFYTVCGTREATQRACSMLAEPVIASLNACVSDAALSSDAYVQRLVDVDIVLRSLKRACEHTAGEVSATIAHLVFSAAASIERMTLALIDPKLVEQRFKMSWALKSLVELIDSVDGLDEVVARICVEAFSRCGSPELGGCYLDPLSLACELYGDRAFVVLIQGVPCHSLGHVVAELLVRTLPVAIHEPDSWMSVFSLCRAAVRNGFAALCPHVELLIRVSRESLRGVADEAAVVAISLCMDLLRSPVMLDPHASSMATIQISQTAMNAGMGRIAAEVSGEATRKRGVCPWKRSDAGSRLLAKTLAVKMEQGGAALLVRGLLEGGNGAMPPSMISDIAASLHLTWSTFGTESFRRVLEAALGGDEDAFPKAKSTLSEKLQWIEMLTGDTSRGDCRIFKRLLKAFLSGKKIGAN